MANTKIICRRRGLFWLLLAWLLAPAGFAGSQPVEPSRFRHLTIEDGLSQSAVYALLQDRQGFIWIGTKDGLNRYDGYRFTAYQHDSFDSASISNNYITALFEDRHGYLWVGTLEGGLNRLDRETEHFRRYRSDPEKPGSLNSDRINVITGDREGALWIGSDQGLNRLPPGEAPTSLSGQRSPHFESFRHDPRNPRSLSHDAVNALLSDRSGALWIGTQEGLNRLAAAPTSAAVPFEHFMSGGESGSGLLENWICSLYESSGGVLWVGSISGLNRFNPDDQTFTPFAHHYQTYRKGWGMVLEMQEDDHGRLWLPTPDELMIFDPRRQSYRSIRHDPMNPAGLNSNGLTRIIRDRSGVLWIGTNGYGLNLYDPKAERFYTYRRPPDFPSRIARFSVTSVLKDRDGMVWIGADVLYRWNRRSGELKSFETDSDHPEDFGNTGVLSMLQDRSGHLWVACYEGLYRYDPATGKSRHFARAAQTPGGLPEKMALQVFEDRRGRIWVATQNFFSRYDPVTERFHHYRYRRRPATRMTCFTDVYEDHSGNFWLATDDGLIRFDPENGAMRYFRNDPNDPASIGNDVVLSIYGEVREGREQLWLGTAGGGLDRFFIEQERFEHYTIEQGLPNNVVYGVLPDSSGDLWLSSNRGLSRFNPAAGQFRNFDVSNGLQSNEFNTGAYFQSSDGEMFFGGINGLSYFFPGKIQDNPHVPNVVITGLRIFNLEVTPEKRRDLLPQVISRTPAITLSYRENVVTFEFAALDFSAPGKNQYAYRLEGFNEDWITAGSSRQATFTNLPAGEYRFRVKGSNNDGIWNETGATLAVRVLPPPWRSWWAYTLYALVILATLFGVRRYELGRLRLKSRLKLEQLAGEKLRELDQLKSRFFANISHEFRTPLTLILGQTDGVLAGLSGREDRRRLEIALRNARRLLRLINQLLDLSKLESGSLSLKAAPRDIIPLLKNVIFSFEDLAERRQIRLSCHSQVQSLEVVFDPDKLEKVFYNLLSNALKFTPQGGSVIVECALAERESPPQPGGAPGRIEVPSDEPPAGFVDVHITDSGIGISPEHLPHVFDRFYQVENSQAGEPWQTGSGIGLALAKELAELHGGGITVRSELRQGTTFTVRLPLHRPPKETLPDARHHVPLEVKPNGSGGVAIELDGEQAPKFHGDFSAGAADEVADASAVQQGIILVVEDHPDVRAYIRDQLKENYRVLPAADGKEGLAVARQQIPDLIITDVMMPGMDGYQLCQELKKDEKTSHIPVIMLTARAGLDDKIEGLETGADDYLLKPFSARELLVRVHNLIEQRKALRRRFRLQTVVKPSEITATPVDQAFMEKVLAIADARLGEEKFDVSALADAVGMSASQLNRKLRALIDQPAGQMLRSLRLQRAADLLTQNAGTVAEICYQVGFGDQANFTRAFKKQFGLAPGAFRRANKPRVGGASPRRS